VRFVGTLARRVVHALFGGRRGKRRSTVVHSAGTWQSTVVPAGTADIGPAGPASDSVLDEACRRAAQAAVIEPEEATGDSGLLAVGFRIRASEPTGIRVGSVAGASGAATFATFVKANDVTDTTLQKQTLSVTAEENFFVRDNDVTNPHPDLLYVGGVPSYRSILRFVLPPIIKDSSVRLVRATLELTPAEPLSGVRGDRAAVDVVGVSKDIGAKSPPAQSAAGSGLIPEGGSTALFGVDIRTVIERMRGTNGLPSTVFIGLAPEGGSFYLPVFKSTRAAEGKPRLRLTYMRPSVVEQP